MTATTKNIPLQCPDCKGKVTFFHSTEGTRVVCAKKMSGIQSNSLSQTMG